jgi:hypothetical protein
LVVGTIFFRPGKDVNVRVDWIENGFVGYVRWRDGEEYGRPEKMPIEKFLRAARGGELMK